MLQGFPAWQGCWLEKAGLLVRSAAGRGGLRGGGPGWGDVREAGTHRRGPKLQAPGLQLRRLVLARDRAPGALVTASSEARRGDPGQSQRGGGRGSRSPASRGLSLQRPDWNPCSAL